MIQKKSLSKILGTFTKVKTELNAFLDQNAVAQENSLIVIDKATARCDELIADAEQATKVLKNLEKLTGE